MKNKLSLFVYLVLLLCPAGFLAGSSPAPAGTDVFGGAYVIFAGKFGGEITRQEIEKNSAITVDGCAAGSRVFQFTLRINKGGKTSTLAGQSNLLSPEMVTQLKSLSKGDSFEFQQTKAYLPNGKDVVDVRGKPFVVA